MIELSHAQALAEVENGKPGPEAAAFFDLDGTLIAGFSAVPFLRHFLRDGLQSGLPNGGRAGEIVADALRAGADGLLRGTGIEALLARALRLHCGRAAEEFERLGQTLFDDELRARLQAPIVELVFAHRERGHTVVIASSATQFQVEPVARALGIEDVICNRLAVDPAGRLTGELAGSLVFREGKARAIRDFAEIRAIDLGCSHFYADGGEDVPSMHLVGFARPVNPVGRMRATADRRGWPVIRVPATEAPHSQRAPRSGLREALHAALVRIDRSS